MAESEPTRVTGLGLTIPPGTRLNGIFEIERQIGAGGMGMVFVAHNVETGDKVAIKIVRAEMAGNEQVLALFRKEAAVLHRLLHDAIVRYYLFTSDPHIGRPYLATEFVDGTSLADVGRLPREEVLALAERLAGGLQAAHELAVFHRDISPDNVILPGRDVRRAKIIDFGIARSATLGGGTVIGDSIAGKFDYMSPEQLGLYGGQVDARSDIYSLGIVLAEAVLGESLRMGGTQLEVVEKRRKVPDLSAVEPKLRGLLTAMLQPRPEDRIASMAAVAEEAGRLRTAGVGGAAKRPLPVGRIAAAVGALVVVGGAAGWFLMPREAARDAPEAPPPLVRQSEEAPPLVATTPATPTAPEDTDPGAGTAAGAGGDVAAGPDGGGDGAGDAAVTAGDDAAAGSTDGDAGAPTEVVRVDEAAVATGGEGEAGNGAAIPAAAGDGAPDPATGAAGDATTASAGPEEAAPAGPGIDPAEAARLEEIGRAQLEAWLAGAGGSATEDAPAAGDAGDATAAVGRTTPVSGDETAGAQASQPEAAEGVEVAGIEPGESVAAPGETGTAVPAGAGGTADASEATAPGGAPDGQEVASVTPDEGAPSAGEDETEVPAGAGADGRIEEARLSPDAGGSGEVAGPTVPVEAGTATDADEGTVEEARLPDPATDLPGRIRQFLAGANLGPCTFVTLGETGPERADIVAYGNSVPPFQRLDETFRDTFRFSADINLRPVTDGQCPALALAQALDPPGGSEQLSLAVDRDTVAPGGLLSGTISGIGQRKLHLYLVGGDGHLYGLADLIERSGDVATFRASMASGGDAPPQYVLVAVAARSLPDLPSRLDGNSAGDLETLRAYLADDDGAEAALGYFKYGG